jgi:hypothetical protein
VAPAVAPAAAPAVTGALGALDTTKITKDEVKDMGGSLKVHVRLNIEVDVRVIAKVKGDIAIGIL